MVGHELRTPRYNSVQALVGTNYHFFEGFRFAVNIELIGTNSKIDLETRNYDDSNIRFETKLKF